jgi:hypothetical protein
LDLAPDIMSSLGILGTFVGLVWGLKSFSTADTDVMIDSISSLVDGIKIAFLTSIYGLVANLVFSYSANKGYSSMMSSLQIFLDRFHTYLIPPAEIDAQNRMVHSQKGQYEVLKQIAVDVNGTGQGSIEGLTPYLERIESALGDTLADICETNHTIQEDMSSLYKQVADSNASTEKLINLLQDFCQKNDELSDMQREILQEQKDTLEELSETQKSLVDSILNAAE